eukprot:457951_1
MDVTVPTDMSKKFAMITDINLPNDIRRTVSLTITQTWRQLRSNGRDYITKENPFANANDISIINYLVTPIGKGFIDLLSAVARTKNYDQLCIQDRVSAFHTFWIKTLADIAQQQTQVAIVDILSQKRYQNYEHIHRAFEQSGGIISSGRPTEC